MAKDGVLERLAKGIYLYPKKDPVLGNLYPSTEEIADNIAKRDKAKIVPTGAAALNKLGLSTQVPMNVTYLTDGAARKIKIGKQQITFKSTTAKRLSTKGKITTLAIHALQEIGQNNLNRQVLDDLKPLFMRNQFLLFSTLLSKFVSINAHPIGLVPKSSRSTFSFSFFLKFKGYFCFEGKLQ